MNVIETIEKYTKGYTLFRAMKRNYFYSWFSTNKLYWVYGPLEDRERSSTDQHH